ncbi:hypothetical protein JNW88_00285 [Micromonospora sp. ATA32]|nr:hypothetical protein [Micromonospora sp. ATA32]
MTGPRITDTDLPLVASVIDAIDAAATGDLLPAADLAEQLTPEQATYAIALLVGIAAGAVNQLGGMSGVPRDVLIRHIRQRAAS